MSANRQDIVEYSVTQGNAVLQRRSRQRLKEKGQFITPAPVARFMARRIGPIRNNDRVLDPAVGSGTLVSALIERIVEDSECAEIWVDGYEIDPEMCRAAREVLAVATSYAASQGVIVHSHVYEADYITGHWISHQQHSLWEEDTSSPQGRYTHVVANPPYFKLNRNDERVKKGHIDELTYGEQV